MTETTDSVVDNCTFTNNYALVGGGINIKDVCEGITISNSIFNNNVASPHDGKLQGGYG